MILNALLVVASFVLVATSVSQYFPNEVRNHCAGNRIRYLLMLIFIFVASSGVHISVHMTWRSQVPLLSVCRLGPIACLSSSSLCSSTAPWPTGLGILMGKRGLMAVYPGPLWMDI